jgi:hypothetical protein
VLVEGSLRWRGRTVGAYKTQTVGGLWVLSGTGVPLPEELLVTWVGSAEDMLLLLLLVLLCLILVYPV